MQKGALVIGGGVAGVQSALDLANAGYKVYLVERGPYLGGRTSQIHKIFTSMDCTGWILGPRLMDVGRHPNITILTLSELKELQGEAGNFRAKILQHTRSVDIDKCTGCGDCWNNCLVYNRPEIKEMPSIKEKLEPAILRKVDEIIDINGRRRDNIIGILQGITKEYNWLPKDAISYVAERLEVPFSYVYRIASFYTQFSLKPRGKHIIKVCLGTACFVRGSPKIISQIQSDLGIAPGETTDDGLFTLETVNCLGACALGPLMVVDADYHGRVKIAAVKSVLKNYS